MDTSINQIILRGFLDAKPVYSHENHGRMFYQFPIRVPRLSGAVDLLQVIAPWEVLEQTELDERVLEVTGQIRSFNRRTDAGRRLVISVYASRLDQTELPPENQAELTGTICKAPVFRRTPLGREICDIMLAVNRSYHRSDYIPVILWGRTAYEVSQMEVGDMLHLTGRLQSREYQKVLPEGTVRRVAYEVSAIQAEPILA